MSTQPPLDETDDLLAAEYVMGLLPLPVRSAAEQRMKRDPGFADAVTAWENRLEGLNENYVAVKAPDLLPVLEARLFGPPPAPRRPLSEVLGGSLRGWLAGAGVAVAVAVLVLAFVPVQPPVATTPLVTLAAEALDLRYDIARDGDALRVTRVAGAAAGAGQVHELWLIVGDAAPVSLGLIEGDTVVLAARALAPGAVLAVSLEPAGGSPTGAPTGPVLVTGAITQG